jgi:hypothetical protein
LELLKAIGGIYVIISVEKFKMLKNDQGFEHLHGHIAQHVLDED